MGNRFLGVAACLAAKVVFGVIGCLLIGKETGSESLGLGCWAAFVALAFFND